MHRIARMSTVWIDYSNHRGVRRWRQIIPRSGALRFGSTPWHKEQQWLFHAEDVTPEAFSGVPPKGHRTFAMKDVHKWSPDAPEPRMIEPVPEEPTDAP
jgi:hypothetical protein